MLALASAMLFGGAAPAAAASEFDTLRSIARAQVGDPFLLGTDGPDRFDCSGLLSFAFDRAGLLDRIGGYRRARGYRAVTWSGSASADG